MQSKPRRRSHPFDTPISSAPMERLHPRRTVIAGCDDYIVLVGGAPLNEEFGMAVGADAYCRDAGVAAETARRLIDERRARVVA